MGGWNENDGEQDSRFIEMRLKRHILIFRQRFFFFFFFMQLAIDSYLSAIRSCLHLVKKSGVVIPPLLTLSLSTSPGAP